MNSCELLLWHLRSATCGKFRCDNLDLGKNPVTRMGQKRVRQREPVRGHARRRACKRLGARAQPYGKAAAWWTCAGAVVHKCKARNTIAGAPVRSHERSLAPACDCARRLAVRGHAPGHARVRALARTHANARAQAPTATCLRKH